MLFRLINFPFSHSMSPRGGRGAAAVRSITHHWEIQKQGPPAQPLQEILVIILHSFYSLREAVGCVDGLLSSISASALKQAS